MRGNAIGALDGGYRHSPITRALWYAVEELEHVFSARLFRTVALSSLYAHKEADFDHGGEHMREAYITALNTLPYMHVGETRDGGADDLVNEWRRINEEEAARKAAEHGKEATDANR